MDKPQSTLLIDIGIGLAAGVVATTVTKFAQQALYKPMPAEVKRQEEAVRPGEPPEVAAQKAAILIGVGLDDKQRKMAGMAVKYALGTGWGPIYSLLRRHSRMDPLGAGFVAGAAMSLVVDEAVTPAMGFSAPSHDYPTLTHVRGFVGHLVFGAVLAVTAEALYRVMDTAPEGQEDAENMIASIFKSKSG